MAAEPNSGSGGDSAADSDTEAITRDVKVMELPEDTDADASTARSHGANPDVLRVVVCTCNVGNAVPTSVEAWIPDDGDLSDPLRDTLYPLPGTPSKGVEGGEEKHSEKIGDNENSDDSSSSTLDRRSFADIIVVGMQEAAFDMHKKDASKDETAASTQTNDASENNSEANEDSEVVSNLSESKDPTASKGARNKRPLVMSFLEVGEEGNVTSGRRLTMIDDTEEAKPRHKKKGGKAKKNNPQKVIKKTGKKTGKGAMTAAATVTAMYKQADKGVNKGVTVMKGATASSDLTKEDPLGGPLPDDEDPIAHRAQKYSPDMGHLYLLITHRLPSYRVKIMFVRGEMRLFVLVREDISQEVSDIDCDAENTGIGSVLANKGGIVGTMMIRNTRLSFLTAHLEAHEGSAHCAGRNSNLAEILGGARVGPLRRYVDASSASHHMFVCGDLNYRIVLPGNKDMEHSEHVKKVQSMVKEKDWEGLNAADELASELKKEKCLVGFQTLPCNFPPTFKVAREEGLVWNEKRTPSYTDRILWKSADGLGDAITPILYEPCPSFITSDHKPIRGAFEVNISSNRKKSSPTTAGNTETGSEKPKGVKRSLYLLVTSLECSNLTAMDIGGKSDPYCMFVSDPKSILREEENDIASAAISTLDPTRKWPHTKVKTTNLNPKWKRTVHLKMKTMESSDDTAGSILHIIVMDHDLHSTDDHIGSVSLNVSRLCSEISPSDQTQRRDKQVKKAGIMERMERPTQETEIDRPLLLDGLLRGHIKCKIIATWMAEEEFKFFMAKHSNLDRKHKKKGEDCAVM